MLPARPTADHEEHLARRLFSVARSGAPIVVNGISLSTLGGESNEVVSAIQRADVVVCDGRWLHFALVLRGIRSVPYLPIPWLCESLLREADTQSYRVALIGGTPEAARLARETVTRKYPGCLVCSWSGYHDKNGWREMLREAAAYRPDLALFGLSSPLKETQMQRLAASKPPCVIVACGGYLDILAGIRSAPTRLGARAGFWWLWRLAQEPRRLFHRYGSTIIRTPAIIRSMTSSDSQSAPLWLERLRESSSNWLNAPGIASRSNHQI